tara:strand:- start:81 stop:917 length:837 start_codon:yes stop_codon:yes gene_type:complete
MLNPICRICYEETNTQLNPLINPCRCDGSSKYVHKECLEKWRYSDLDNLSHRRDKCMECNYNYKIEEVPHECSLCYYMHVIIVEQWINLSPVVTFLISFIVTNLSCDLNKNIDLTLELETTNVYFTCFNYGPFCIISLYILLFWFYYFLFPNVQHPILFLFSNIFIFLFCNFILILLGPIGIILDTIFLNIYLNHYFYKNIKILLQPKEKILNYNHEYDINLESNSYIPPVNNETLVNNTIDNSSDSEISIDYISSTSDYSDDDEIIIITTNNNIIHD